MSDTTESQVQIVPMQRGAAAIETMQREQSFKASELRKFYRDSGLSGKELTTKVNEVLDAQATPAGQARFNLRVTQGYRMERLSVSKTGRETYALVPRKADKATPKIKELQAEIERLRAEINATKPPQA